MPIDRGPGRPAGGMAPRGAAGGRPSPSGMAGRAAPGRSGGGASPAAGRGAGMAGRGAPGGMAARRDVTEKGEKPVYFSQLNFDETTNDYLMTKMTFGTLAFIVVFAAATFLFDLGTNFIIATVIMSAFWLAYFISSLAARPRMASMPYQEKKGYWTYERTPEYRNRNVVLNDFKRNIAQELLRSDRTVLIDDVSVELMSFDPLIFDFSIRANVKKDTIKRQVPEWGSKLGCEVGTITSTGVNSWRVVYPRHSKWETLALRKVSPKDAVGEVSEPALDRNPIGIRTDNFSEVCIDQAQRHTIVSGQSGYGKSNMFNMILVNQFPTDAIILFFDAKGNEAPAGSDRWFSVTCFEQATAWAKAILKEMGPNGRRKTFQVKQGNKKKFLPAEKAANDPDAVPFSPDFPPIIIAVDECASWTNVQAGDSLAAHAFTDFLKNVAQKGRAFGITLLVAAQVPKDSAIPSDVRSQADQYIAFQQSAEYQKFAFGAKGVDISAVAPADIPVGDAGVGQFAFSSPDTHNVAVPVKGYYITSDTVEKQAKAYSRKKRTNNPVIQDAIRNYEEQYAKSKNKSLIPVKLF